MKKFLCNLMLMAFFALPFASHAQNTLTVADSTATNSYVPVYGLYVDDFVRCQTIYPASMLTDATAGDMTGNAILGLTYYLSTSAEASWGTANFVVNIKEVSGTTLSAFNDMSGATTVYTGSLDATQSTMQITFTTPYIYMGGNLLIEVYNTLEGTYKSASFYGINATGASWQGYNSSSVAAISGSVKNFIPKTTFNYGNPPACLPVTGLAVSDITSTSATISWSGDASGYVVYEYANADSNGFMVTDTFLTFNTLEPNTNYTFGVVADCGSDGESVMQSISFRTACGAISSLPFTEGFEAVPSGSYQMPFCWNRYASAYTSTSVYPYSYSSTTYAHSGSRSLYFYGTTGSTYSDTMVAILPELDVNTYPMNGNRITFWARMGAASNSKNVYVGTMTDPTDPTTFVMIDTVLVSGATQTLYSVSLNNASASAPYVALAVMKGTGSMYIDDLTLEVMPSCLEITGLATSNVTSSSVDLSWDDNSNASSTTYSVYLMSEGNSLLVDNNITSTSYTVNNLTPNTSYTFGVQANCAGGDATIMTISATTACAAEAFPWSENFDNWTAKSPCWSFMSGAYNGGAGTPSTLSSAWTLNSTYGTYITITGKALTMNVYSTNRYWAVTPNISIDDNNAMFSVDVAVAAWSTSAPTYDADDTLAIAISTDGGSTFTNLRVLDNTQLNALTNTYTTIYVPVTGYNGQNVRFAIFAGSSASGGDNRIAIDNVTVGLPISCMAPTMPAASSVTSNSATLTWVGDADSYTIYDMSDTSVYQTVYDTTIALSNLTPATTYTFGIAANCGSDESSIVTVSFTTACEAVTVPFTEGFEATSSTLSCWSFDGPGTWSIGTGDYHSTTGAFEGSVNAKIQHSSTGDVTKLISPVLDNITNGISLTYAHIQRSWSGDQDELRVYYRATVDGAWQQVAAYTNEISTWTVDNVIIPGSVYQVAFEMTDGYGYGVAIDSIVFDEAPGCLPVASLTVDSATTTSVFLSWIGNASSYTVFSSTGSVIASGITTNSYEVTGLTSSTAYTFGVAANCGSENSDTIYVNAATACGGSTCFIEINGTDAYGDGWNGNAINIMQNGVVIHTFTLPENTDLYQEQIPVCSESPVSFAWVAGQYPDEVFFEIKYAGIISYTITDASNLVDDSVFHTIASACPSCIPAANLTVSAATENSITISWTGTAASYDIYNGSNFVANVTNNTYTFTGLTTSTTYTFGVQAICSASDTADMVTITAVTSCADITSLPYVEGFENGLGCWSSVNGSADGNPWFTSDLTSLESIVPHGGDYVVSSWSWNGTPIHANAWLISPKFVLPNTGDSIILSWWEATNPNYPDSYSVAISTTTNDTTAFTVVRPSTPATGSWTIRTIDLTSYAGQSIYIAFHHVDYDENYLLIDDITLSNNAPSVPADSVHITFAVNDPTMGTTNPAPGTYAYVENSEFSVTAIPAQGYQFASWSVTLTYMGQTSTLPLETTSATLTDTAWIDYEDMNMVITANFAPDSVVINNDSVTIISEVNNAAWGTVYPAVGPHTYGLGESILVGAVPNDGYYLSAIYTTLYFNGTEYLSDTVYAEELGTENGEPLFDTLLVDEDVLGATFKFRYVFAPLHGDAYMVTIAVNDATMGTTTPAPGVYTYTAGETVTITADPYDGYKLERWSTGETTNTITVTVNGDMTITAWFAPTQGIDDVDGVNFRVFDQKGDIVLKGAEGREVYVFDLNGRMLHHTATATETEVYNTPASGAYLIKVGDTTKRVVIIK